MSFWTQYELDFINQHSNLIEKIDIPGLVNVIDDFDMLLIEKLCFGLTYVVYGAKGFTSRLEKDVTNSYKLAISIKDGCEFKALQDAYFSEDVISWSISGSHIDVGRNWALDKLRAEIYEILIGPSEFALDDESSRRIIRDIVYNSGVEYREI